MKCLFIYWTLIVIVGSQLQTPAFWQHPFIRFQPRDLIVRRGELIHLSCYVMGHPFPNVTWYKDDEVVDFTKLTYMTLERNFSLVIKNPVHNKKRQDGGKYKCIARNVAGSEESRTATVTVPYIEDEFRRSPRDKIEYQTKDHQFECIPPNGYPRPKVVEWRKDGKTLFQIKDDKKTRKYNDRWFFRREGKVRILSFWTRLDSAGVYTCVARNSEGLRISKPAKLTVKVIPPEVTMTKLREVHVGDEAVLSCEIKHPVPAPQRTWSKGNGQMPDKSRVTETDDGKLIIQRSQESDSGNYTCFTKNVAGGMSRTGKLIVYKKPEFVVQPTDVKIPVGQTAKFECKARYGKDVHIKYKFDNKLYDQQQSQSDKVYVNNKNELVIPNVQLSDSNKFIHCFVNDMTKFHSASDVSLIVLNTVKNSPSVTLTPLKQAITEGSRLRLTCTSPTPGSIEFKWYSAGNNIQLLNNVGGVTIRSFPGGSNFTIDNVISSDGRAYRCKVSGDGGTRSQISMITVKPTAGKVPGLVPYVRVRDIKSTEIKLIWGLPPTKLLSPVIKYIIKVKNILKGTEEQVVHVPKGYTQKVIEKLLPSTVYSFSVAGVNAYGKGPSADSANIETIKFVPTSSVSAGGKVDKLLDVTLRLTLGAVTDDQIEFSWNPVKLSRIDGYTISYRPSGQSHSPYIHKNISPSTSKFMILNLNHDVEYEIKMKAYNRDYESQESALLTVTTNRQVYIPAPEKVGIVKKDFENLEIHWSPPMDFDKMKHPKYPEVDGYQLSCIDSQKKEFFVGTVNKQAKRYILSGLDTWESYTVFIRIKTKYKLGLKSKEYTFVLGNMRNGEVIGALPDRPSLKKGGNKSDSNILDVIKEPWFIATIGTLVWLFLFVIVVLICCRRARKRRRQRRYNDSARGLIMHGNRTLDGADTTLTRTRWENSTTAYDVTPREMAPPKRKRRGCCRSKSDSMSDDDFPNRADIKPLMTYTRHDAKHESVEMRSKGANGDANLVKENNTAIAMKNGYMVDMPLNNELSLNHRNYDSGDEYPRKCRVGLSQDLTPSIHSDTGSRRDTARSKTDSAERRHAEIVRTAANKSFPDAELVNVMETNPQASWKREKKPPVESPKLPPPKPPGENTLRRQAKSQFKPLPQLEVLNWSDGLPNLPDPSVHEGSQMSAPSSPKLSSSASMFSESVARPESRLSHNGSATSLNKYPFEKRRRKTSNASSMLSSELYQSEMDPSAYSDIASDRKKKKDKAIPPPIDLEGLTSDILLQWAESVTNSSPSSSGSSSPSRLSGISSEGSIYTDEDFAQAVAAVAECGGFNMDYDYSLPGMPGTQPPYPSTRNAKMNKIDEVLNQRSKLRNNLGGPKTNDPHPMTGPNSFIPQISMSSYLTGSQKGTPSSYGGQSGIPRASSGHHRKRSNPSEKNSRYGTGFQDVDSAVSAPFKPLTVSSLMEHDSSLGREKKEPSKPLTVSNLRQHDTSLDRALKSNERPIARGGDPPPGYSDRHSNKSNNLMPEAPLSVISALERNESMNSNSKDSVNSSSRQDSEVENGNGTSERPKKHVANGHMNPAC